MQCHLFNNLFHLILFYLQIDLKSADPDSVSKQMEKLFDITQDEVLKVRTF